MPPFLPGRRPTPAGKESCHPLPPPRQVLMSLEVSTQPPTVRLKNHPAGGSAFFCVKIVGSLEAHGAVFPVRSGEGSPMGCVPDLAGTVNQTLPETSAKMIGELA